MITDEFKQLAQTHRIQCAGDLRRRTDRQIDQEMGRAGGELLRHDRRHHLFARVDGERPLHRDQDVVGRRKIDVAAPDQAAVARGHHLLHLLDAKVDARQHFHGVGGPGRRSDRSRGGLRDHQSVRGDDRHHNHRRAVAGNAADTVLVDDDPAVPLQLCTGIRHRARQRQQFAAGHEARRADQEGGNLHVGITVMRNILNDRPDLGVTEHAALDFGAHRSRLSGGVAGVTVTELPTGSPKRRKAGSARPSSSGATMPSL